MPWISAFFGLFASGTLLASATVPRGEVGDRFHRVCVTTAMFFAIVAAMTSGLLSDVGGRFPARGWMGAYGLALLGYAVYVRFPGRAARPAPSVGLAAVGIAIVYYGLAQPWSWGLMLSMPTSAAALGAAIVAMLLGHSYLASATMSFDLLVNACRVLMGALVVRAAVSAAFFIPDSGVVATWLERDAVLALLVGVRYGVGVGAALALSWMALACAKIRSNQSATGILYVALGFVVMGELVAAYVMGGEERLAI